MLKNLAKRRLGRLGDHTEARKLVFDALARLARFKLGREEVLRERDLPDVHGLAQKQTHLLRTRAHHASIVRPT